MQRLNDLGVIIDVSQMSSKALAQAVALSRAPVVASHSVPRAMVDIRRNLSDKELQLIKDSGGVVQLVAFSTYLKPLSSKTQDKLNALRARYDLPPLANLDYALMPGDPVIAGWPEQKVGQYANALYGILEEEPPATLKDYGDAIDYTVRKIGIDHVGLSSDFNEGGGIDGWQNASEARNVTAELISRGYSEADIAKLWGGNFLRVWEQVQRAAHPVATSSPDLASHLMNDRRTFLKQAGLLAASLPLTGPLLPAAQAAAAQPATASDWAGFRNLFELDPAYAHFANFLITSHPRPVREAIEALRARFDHHPARMVDWDSQSEWKHEAAVREWAARYLEVTPRQIALTGSTTEGLGLIYGGLKIAPGRKFSPPCTSIRPPAIPWAFAPRAMAHRCTGCACSTTPPRSTATRY